MNKEKTIWRRLHGGLLLWLMVGCLLLLPVGLRAQREELASFEVTAHSSEQLAFTFQAGPLATQPVGDDYQVLTVAGLNQYSTQVGYPLLPVLNVLVAIPEGTRPQVEIVADETVVVPLASLGGDALLLPAQESERKRDGDTATFRRVKSIYDTDAYYGLPLASISVLGTMRHLRLARLTVSPVEYNAVRGIIRLHTRLSVRVVYQGADAEATQTQYRRYGNSRFEAGVLMAKHAVTPTGGERYVVVSRPAFASALQPFVQWKRQLGFRVDQLYLTTSHRDTIKQYLQQLYDGATSQHPAPTYILLVGDMTQLQGGRCRYRMPGFASHQADLYYADYTDDWLPEAMVGRWPVADTAQLRAVVEKSIAYEQLQMADTAYLNRALLVAGSEDRGMAPIVTNGQVYYIGTQLRHFRGGIDTLSFHSDQSMQQRDSILRVWSRGVGHVNYSGHCFATGWFNPTIALAQVDSLPSDGRYHFVINNCCLSNAFTGDCFGSRLICHRGGGAIGVIGATNETLWNEDFYWSVGAKAALTRRVQYDSVTPGAYDRWLHSHGEQPQAHSQGEVLLAGNRAVTQYGTPYAPFYWEVYHLFGDPSLMPYMGVPSMQQLWVEQPVVQGAATLTVRGEVGSRLSVTDDTTLLASVVLRDSGMTTLTLSSPIAHDSIVVTVVGQYRMPVVRRVACMADTAARVVVSDASVFTDSGVPCRVDVQRAVRLRLVVVNRGLRPALGYRLQLLSDTTVGASTLSFTPSVWQLDSLAPMDSDTLWCTLTVVADGETEDVALLTWCADTAGCGVRQRWVFDVCRPYPMVQQVSLWQGEQAVTQLWGDTVYDLRGVLTNTGCGAVSPLRLRVYAVDTMAVTMVPVDTLWHDTLYPNDTMQWMCRFRTADSISVLGFRVQTDYEGHTAVDSFFFVAGRPVETFERGAFTAFDWDTTSPHPWRLVDDTVRSGLWAARSGVIGARQVSDLSLTVTVVSADSVGFWYKTDSEEGYDQLLFYVDGDSKGHWSGLSSWQYFAMPLSAGRHTLLWRYQKDDTLSVGSDGCWIDDVCLPLSCYTTSSVGYAQWVGAAEPQPAVAVNTVTQRRPVVWVSPNPVADILRVYSTSPIHQVTVWNAQGQCVGQLDGKSSTTVQYSMSLLRSSIYFVMVITTDGICTVKVVKQ